MLIACVYSFNDKLYCMHIISIHICSVSLSANAKFKINKTKLHCVSFLYDTFFLILMTYPSRNSIVIII